MNIESPQKQLADLVRSDSKTLLDRMGGHLLFDLLNTLSRIGQSIRQKLGVFCMALAFVFTGLANTAHAQSLYNYGVEPKPITPQESVTLLGLEYAASYPLFAIGENWELGVNDYMTKSDSRLPVIFSACNYIASYPDLANAFGEDYAAGARHFIKYGRAENRKITFNGYKYMLANPDVRAFMDPTDPDSACRHYIRHGRYDGHRVSIPIAI